MRGIVSGYALLIAVWLMCGIAMADDDNVGVRTAWHFTNEDVVATITRQEDGSWIGIRNDGRRPVYDEIEITDDYILIQNRQTMLFLRLHEDWGYWKRPTDEDWTRWIRGEWTDGIPEGPLPASLGGHLIRVAYFVPTDRNPADEYAQRIRTILSVVSDLYGYSLSNRGYDFDGLPFEETDGEVVIHLIRGEHDAAHYHNAPQYNANEQWRRIAPEVRSHLGSTDEQVILVFAETYGFGSAENLWPGTIARGAYYTADGGLAIYSSHLLQNQFGASSLTELRDLFFDQTPVQGRRALGHEMNTPRCEFVEDGIGAIAHELGHAFGLPHDRREDSLYIMGNGFRNLRWNLDPQERRRVTFSEENARLLMSSRYIANDLDLEDSEPPVIELEQLSSNANSQLILVRASDNTGLRAIVFQDTEAGSIITGDRLSGTEQELRQRLPLNGTGGFPINLQVIVTDDGGHQTRARLTETNF